MLLLDLLVAILMSPYIILRLLLTDYFGDGVLYEDD